MYNYVLLKGDEEVKKKPKTALQKILKDIEKLPEQDVDRLEKILRSRENLEFCSIKQAAAALGVSTDTIRRGIKIGSIRAIQIVKKGNWRIPLAELKRLKGEK